MKDDKPTPAPMADEEDDCATQVWREQILPPPPKAPAPAPPPQSGVVDAPPSKPHVSMVVERPSIAAPVRDTIVDPPPTLWERVARGARRFGAQVGRDFFGTEARLSPELPPVPPAPTRDATVAAQNAGADDERGEQMLEALVRAPPRYQRAAMEVALYALGVRRRGEEAYDDFTVHFALSRMRPDRRGRIAIAQVIDGLPYLLFFATIAPALRRLEERGVLILVLDTSGGDPMTVILREKVTHIELRIPV